MSSKIFEMLLLVFTLFVSHATMYIQSTQNGDTKYASKTVNEDCMIHIERVLELHMHTGKHLDLVLSSKPCGANVIGSNPSFFDKEAEKFYKKCRCL